MDSFAESMSRLERVDDGDGSWQRMVEEAVPPLAYNPVDTEQLPYDVPLPMGLIQDHPEPLLIDRGLIPGNAHGSGRGSKRNNTALVGSRLDTLQNAGSGSGSEESGCSLPLCNAEPMTQEEAEAFDITTMGSCFLEFGAFGMSQPSREEPRDFSHRTDASCRAAEALHAFQAKGLIPMQASNVTRRSTEGRGQMQPAESTGQDPGSNRSSFDLMPGACRLYSHSGWDAAGNSASGWVGGGNGADQARPTMQAIRSAASPRRLPSAAEAERHEVEQQQQQEAAAERSAVQAGALGGSHAAQQALCMGLDGQQPQLSQTQREMMQAKLQQHLQKQSQQQQQQQGRRETTPVLQQSHMQLSLGMGLGLKLDLDSWCYGLTVPADGSAPIQASEEATEGSPRASSTALKRGAREEDLITTAQAAAEQQSVSERRQSWSMPMGVTAASVQNVHSGRLGSALMAPEASPGQAGRGGPHAEYVQHLAGAINQETLQSQDIITQAPFEDMHQGAAVEAGGTGCARACSKLAGQQELSVRHESLERYRDKKRRRMFSNAKTIRYEKRKVNADRRPRVKGRFVKQLDPSIADLETIKEDVQLAEPQDCEMGHASDADEAPGADDEDP